MGYEFSRSLKLPSQTHINVFYHASIRITQRNWSYSPWSQWYSNEISQTPPYFYFRSIFLDYMFPYIDYTTHLHNINNSSHWLIATTTREALWLAPAKRSSSEVSDKSMGALWTGFILPSRNKWKECHCLDTCLLHWTKQNHQE